jgi:hypothetical protein
MMTSCVLHQAADAPRVPLHQRLPVFALETGFFATAVFGEIEPSRSQ